MPKVFNAAAAKVGDVVMCADGTRMTVLAITPPRLPKDDYEVVVWTGAGFAPYVVRGDGEDIAAGASSDTNITHFAPVIETYWLCPNAVNNDRGQYFTNEAEAKRLDPNAICVQREV